MYKHTEREVFNRVHLPPRCTIKDDSVVFAITREIRAVYLPAVPLVCAFPKNNFQKPFALQLRRVLKPENRADSIRWSVYSVLRIKMLYTRRVGFRLHLSFSKPSKYKTATLLSDKNSEFKCNKLLTNTFR